jgi:hypothetical protein
MSYFTTLCHDILKNFIALGQQQKISIKRKNVDLLQNFETLTFSSTQKLIFFSKNYLLNESLD